MTMDAAIADHRSKTHAKRYFAAVFVDASKRNSTRVWFVTLDETWIHYHTPESKQQSKQWTASGKCMSKKVKTVLSVKKIIFWDFPRIIFFDYL